MITCQQCGKEFQSTQALGGHMRWIHGLKKDGQVPLLPSRRFITDMELVEMFRKRDESNHQARMDLLDLFHKRTKELLDLFDKRTQILLGEIQRLDKEQLELKQACAKVLEQFGKVSKQSNKVKVKVKS